eukprot:TRINITY_DN30833_c0_g1_i1.p1 TRINITY_DN30833_c0_g1~~TRINITY_DN30833_c0_g1_i1.p1  ORF type:complete len:517 (-),score=73.50 TRINITY_DN30833_c0_g1_i1:11-1561(-)
MAAECAVRAEVSEGADVEAQEIMGDDTAPASIVGRAAVDDGYVTELPSKDSDEEEAEAPVHWQPRDLLRHILAGHIPAMRAFLAMFWIEFIGFSLLIPVLPFFCIHELGMGPQDVGALLSAFSMAQFVGSAVCGRVSDSVGRRPVLIFCFTWAALGFSSTALVQSFIALLAVRILQGLSGGTTSVCDAYILDIASESMRPAYLGLVGCTRALAFLVGPATGALLVKFGFNRRLLFVVSGCFGLGGALIGALFLQESLPRSKRLPLFRLNGTLSCLVGLPKTLMRTCRDMVVQQNSSDGDDAKAAAAARAAANLHMVTPALLCVWFCRFVSAAGQGILFATHAFLIKDLFGWGDAQFGAILFFAGIVGGVTQFFLFPRVVVAIGPAATLGIAYALGAVSYLLFPEPFLPVYLVALICFVLSTGFSEPVLPVLIGRCADEHALGFANGVAGSARSLAVAASPLFAGSLYEDGAAWAYGAGAAFYFCGILSAIMLARLLPPPTPRKDEVIYDEMDHDQL